MKYTLLSVILCFSVAIATADVVSDARMLIDGADYAAAAEMIRAELKRVPKGSQTGVLNEMLGECLMEDGDYESARDCFEVAKAKGVADAYRFHGRLAYLDYDYEQALEHYTRYKQLKASARKPIADEAEIEQNRIADATAFLDRVEKIAVIDSIAVDYSDFYKAFRIPSSAGHLASPEVIPFPKSRKLASMAYVNEAGDFMMWAEPDTIGFQRIFESMKLTDGTWHLPVLTDEGLLPEGDSDYPFMMSDGLTLYFANDGPGSIGGYDIFVASRDAASGEYLQPSNIGMPYNSPYDDFMLAIDELNGVGWWATDRNRLDGKVTIYVFIVNEIRTNYNSDEDDVVAFARLNSISDTQDGQDYSEILAVLANIDPNEKVKKAEFYLPIEKGKVYKNFEELPTPAAKEAMKTYIAAQKKYAADEASLYDMRRRYASSKSPQLGAAILEAEKSLETELTNVRRLKSNVYRTLKRKINR